MDLDYCRIRLRQSAAAIVALAQGVTLEQARWKPTPEEWSLLEVICHLCDEEREDFRQRLDLTLHHPEADWPPIHPSAWVTERAYNQRDLPAMVAAFAQERDRSLAWLDSLSHPDWSAGAHAPGRREDDGWRYAGRVGRARSSAHSPTQRTALAMAGHPGRRPLAGVCWRLVAPQSE